MSDEFVLRIGSDEMFQKSFHDFKQDKQFVIKVVAGILFLVIAFSIYVVKEFHSKQSIDLFRDTDLSISSSESVIEDTNHDREIDNDQTTSTAINTTPSMIMVDVSGAVRCPSVVSVSEGSRVFEAIALAGGLSEDADVSAINQAERLSDEEKIYVPTKEENMSGALTLSVNSPASDLTKGLVNINTADSTTLQTLTGIGPATAEKIITYRNENGRFHAIDEIKQVSGIGDKTFDKFKDQITI